MIENNNKEKILNINTYIKNNEVSLDDSHIQDVIDLLSLDNPDPRDIIIGIALSNSDRFSTLIDKIHSGNKSDLNVLNIKIILSLYQDRKYLHLVKEAESLLNDNIPGTTLFGLLKSEIDQDDLFLEDDNENIMIYSFILNAEELDRENNLHIF